jgi:hypothetical protein
MMEERSMNATHLFERHPSGQLNSAAALPHSSEHFWTAVFGLFVLHLAGNRDSDLHVWQLMEPPLRPKYFEPHRASPVFNVSGLAFDHISIEPSNLSGVRFGEKASLPIQIAGMSPDLVIRNSKGTAGQESYTFIENKTVGADLSQRQRENYVNLVRSLQELGIQSQTFVLCSTGDDAVYKACREFQSVLGLENFGLVLWEDVLREMKRTVFVLPGLDIAKWANTYTDDLDQDAEVPDNWGIGGVLHAPA